MYILIPMNTAPATETNLDVANTIIAQLGKSAGRLAMMLGAHSFLGGPDSVQFKWRAPSTNKANCVRIVLDASDTYTVEFFSIRGTKVTTKGSSEGVYAEDLRSIFESATGLRVSL